MSEDENKPETGGFKAEAWEAELSHIQAHRERMEALLERHGEAWERIANALEAWVPKVKPKRRRR